VNQNPSSATGRDHLFFQCSVALAPASGKLVCFVALSSILC
jgi:hypothetical protein